MLPDEALGWVIGVMGRGSRVSSAHRLPLGGWHVNHAVEVVDARGRAHRLVLRRWARPGWERDDPDYTVEREVRVLDLLRAPAVPAPVVVAADPTGAQCGVPALLITRLPGDPPGAADAARDDFCRQLADILAQIHDVAGKPALEPYRLYYDRARAAPATWMPATGVWAQAAAAVRNPPPPTTMTLIHRDYHPENTLWSAGRLTGVVDWTQASYGPPALDVAHMRWNLAADHGRKVADRFLDCYRAATGRRLDHQGYWDLVSLLDLLLDGEDPDEPVESELLRPLERYATTLLTDLA